MKKLLLFLSVILVVNLGKSQYVTIPDANFANWLQSYYPNCMSGNQMDTTCIDFATALTVDISANNISSIDGIQYFDNLQTLNCNNIGLTSIPVLPNNLISLDCGANNLIALPSLPQGLEELNCQYNSISILPPLPGTLEALGISINPLTVTPILPNGLLFYAAAGITTFPTQPIFPNSLIFCDISDNNISTLPSLPNGLDWLAANHNPLDTLTALPDSLREVYLGFCGLNGLPSLPSTLEILNCYGNNLTELPSLPASLVLLVVVNNQLTTLPTLPQDLFGLHADSNQIACLPILPQNIASINLNGNPINCLPNYVNALSSTPLDTLPLCVYGNSATNPNGCITASGISGQVYNDTSSNCIGEPGEFGVQNVPLRLYDNVGSLLSTIGSNIIGNYAFYAMPNSYTVELDTANKPYQVLCNSPGIDSSFTLNAIDTLIQNVDFPIECRPGIDLGVQSIVPVGWVFPGLSHMVEITAGDLSQWYGLNCASGINGNVSVTVNGPVSYLGPKPGSLTPIVSGNTFNYTIPDFGIVNMTQDFGLILETDTTTQAGDSICIDVQITPSIGDNNVVNNSYNFCYEVLNSYDPNDKTVYPWKVSPNYNDWLIYTIHFQNIGTAPAFNVRLEDTLSSLLDYSTFEVIGYKHANHFDLTGDKLSVYFPSIMLADSATNEPESHGYFQYRIKPISSLPLGTEIENTAHIFFDYNDAIVTNIALTTYVDDLSILEETENILIYPNPSTGQFYIKSGLTNYTIKAFDIAGRLVDLDIQNLSDKLQVDILQAAKGVVFLIIEADQGVFRKKLILN